MSWTGGGPEFPPTREGQKAHWRDKRTCVLPVKLEAAHYYRVGINSTSYQNFPNQHGVATVASAIFFTTQGTDEKQKAKPSVPKVVRSEPHNYAHNTIPTIHALIPTLHLPC